MKKDTISLQQYGLGFLFKKISKIKPATLSSVVYVSEYIEVLQGFSGEFNDDVIYELLMACFLKMRSEGNCHRSARNTMNKVLRDVKGLSLKDMNL